MRAGTLRMLNGQFARFVTMIGGEVAENNQQIGGYALDHDNGGYVIVQYREHGGESRPFGFRRRPAEEMMATLDFALSVPHIMRENTVSL